MAITDVPPGVLITDDYYWMLVARSENVYLVKGPATDTTAGTWTGTIDGLTAYYEGLVVVYIPHVAGASTTKLNINGLGAKLCTWRDAAKMSTQYAVGSAICMVYRNDLNNNTGGFQALSDYYQSNTNQTVKVGTTTFGANDAVEFVAGENITITPDAQAKKITISSSGGSSPSIITFSISGVNYSAVNGMTWGEWIISKYNTSSIEFKWPETIKKVITDVVGHELHDSSDEASQYLNTVIQAGTSYYLV